MKKVRYITDAAMITAIVIALLLLSELTGLELEESFFFVLPAPIALYALMHGAKKSLIPALAIGLLSMIIHSPIHGLLFVMPACLLGVIYGFFVERGFSSAVKISLAVLGTFVVNVLTMVIFSQILFGISLIADTTAIVTSIVNALSFLHLSASFSALLEGLAIGLIPATIVVTSIMEGLLMHILTIFLATRVAKIEKIGAFRGFKIMVPCLVSYLFVFGRSFLSSGLTFLSLSLSSIFLRDWPYPLSISGPSINRGFTALLFYPRSCFSRSCFSSALPILSLNSKTI
ncbi:MAG: DUF2232 domain-containing protein [Firmicutes bacterium]|nr:DUF2232 domain-containing protein [Bacillota bacterium]